MHKTYKQERNKVTLSFLSIPGPRELIGPLNVNQTQTFKKAQDNE